MVAQDHGWACSLLADVDRTVLCLGTAVLEGIEDAESCRRKLDELHVGQYAVLNPRGRLQCAAMNLACCGMACMLKSFGIRRRSSCMELDRKHLRGGSRRDTCLVARPGAVVYSYASMSPGDAAVACS